MKNRLTLQKLCVAAVLLAACVLITAFVSIPTPIVGNINLGDCITFVACMLLGTAYAPFVGAFGGLTADLLSGYAAYAPVTLVAKGVMALLCCLILGRGKRNLGRSALGMVVGGIGMIACYFVFEWAAYGVAPAAANLLFNTVQVAINTMVALAVYPLIKKITQRFPLEHSSTDKTN